MTLDPKTTAYLVLDVTSVVCTPRKSCLASLPAIAGLLKKARDANVAVVFSETATAGSQILADVAPREGEPKVTGRADKFFGTDLDKILKDKGIQNVVIVGTAANGAVLYTAFGATLRGYTAVVAEDGISEDNPYVMYATRWQLLKQPGFANPENKALEKARVTLSRTDLIGFGSAPTGTPPAAPVPVAVPNMPALSAVSATAKTTAVLVLDVIDPTCGQRPQCLASLPKIADLLKRAREAKAPVLYTITSAQGVSIRPEVAPQSGERLVTGSADKFFGTNLDQNLKNEGVETVVLVGTAAHGAVLYTAFGANLRGYTVVVPEDAISVGPGDDFGLFFTKWQVLNQPGFANADNFTLQKQRVTLSRSDVVTFK